MKSLVLACVLGLCGMCWAQGEAPARIDHLLRAAAHLQAAGLEAEARHCREQAAALRRQHAEETLKQKIKELETLQAEIEALRSQAGPKQISLNCRVVEVSHGKLKALASYLQKTHREGLAQAMAGPIGAVDSKPLVAGESFSLTIVPRQDELNAAIANLQSNRLLKVLADPVLVTLDGRRARFVSGGQFPVVTHDDGEAALEYKHYGTEVDVLPTLLGGDKVKLQLHMRISQRSDETDENGDAALRNVREIATTAEVPFGQTLVLGGFVNRGFNAAEEQGSGESDSAPPAAPSNADFRTP
jgi:Flp pilus assembly secretin CpaC